MTCHSLIRPIFFFLISFSLLSAAGHMEKGNSMYHRGELRTAYREYGRALHAGENAVMARFNRANCLYRMKQVGRALLEYEKLMEESPAFVRPYINAAGIYFELDQVGRSLSLYRKALAYEPENTILVKMIGECWLALGESAEAIWWFEKGRKIDPSGVDWSLAIADVHFGLRDPAGAQASLAHALEIEPEQPSLWFYMAEVEFGLDNAQGGMRALREGLELEPSNRVARFRLSSALEESGMPFQALALLRENLGQGSDYDASALFEMGRIYLEQGDVIAAQKQYEASASLGFSKARRGMIAVAESFTDRGMRREARGTLEKATAFFPEDPELRESLAWLRTQKS